MRSARTVAMSRKSAFRSAQLITRRKKEAQWNFEPSRVPQQVTSTHICVYLRRSVSQIVGAGRTADETAQQGSLRHPKVFSRNRVP